MTYPVIVVGAGPAGLTVSNLLATLGVPVLLLEKNPTTVPLPRAIALDDEGMRTMQFAGLHEELLKLVLPSQGTEYADDDGNVFAKVGAGLPTYGFAKRYLIDQPDVEACLNQGIKRFPHAEVRFSTEVEKVVNHADHVDVVLSGGGILQADWVLACDGARSPIRESLGIEMEGFAYPDRWLVIDTLNDPDHSPTAKFACSLNRPSVSVAAPGGARRYEFRIFAHEEPEQITSFEAVRALVAPFRDLTREDLRRAAVYGFRACVAERWRSGRVLLLGDAAHLTPPFAGQGMNAGLRDTMNLAWKLALHYRGLAGAELIASYEPERKKAAEDMIQLAVTVGEIVMPESDNDRALRAALLNKLTAYPGVRQYLAEMRFKPAPRIADADFVGVTDAKVPGSLIGGAIPQPRVKRDGQEILLDDALGKGFALIMQSRPIAQWAASQPVEFWCGLDPALLLLEKDQGAPIQGVVTLGGLDHPMAFDLLAHRDQALLVRPDHYAAAFFTPDDARATLETFVAKLGSRIAVCAGRMSGGRRASGLRHCDPGLCRGEAI